MFKKSRVAFLLRMLLPQVRTANEDINANSVAQQCYLLTWSELALLELAKRNFDIKSDAERSELAIQLLKCLAVPDARIRDGVAFYRSFEWVENK